MKIRLIPLFAGILILAGVSCTNDKTKVPGDLWILNLEEAVKDQQTALASEFFSEVEMVVLDGKKQWYFPEYHITSRYYKNHVLFCDNYKRGALAVFSRNGDLVLSLDKPGKGPGEYSGMSEFGMDPAEEKVYAAEGYYQKMHWYDLDGNWIETIELPTKFEHVYCLDNGNLLLQNQRWDPDELDSCRLILCNPAGEVIQCVWDKSKEIKDFQQFMDPNCIKQSPQYGILYRDSPMYDTVYQLNEDYELQPFFVMDPGKLRLPEHIATDFNRSDDWINYLRTHYFFFTKQELLISGTFKKWISFRVNLKDQHVTALSEIQDDLLGWRSIPYETTLDGKYAIMSIYVPYYKDHVDDVIVREDVKFPELQKKLRETLLNAGDEVDMILVYYKLK